MGGEPVSRKDAIEHVLGLESSVASEYYVGKAEHDAGWKQTLDALRALGATEEELAEYVD